MNHTDNSDIIAGNPLEGIIGGVLPGGEKFDFVGAFLERIAHEDQQRLYRMLSATPTESAAPVEQPSLAPREKLSIKEHYLPPTRTYTEPELERIIKPPFTARTHVDSFYGSMRPILERYRKSTDAIMKLQHLDKALDEFHAEFGLLRELSTFALNATLLYGHHLPMIKVELSRVYQEIERYSASRKALVTRLLAAR